LGNFDLQLASCWETFAVLLAYVGWLSVRMLVDYAYTEIVKNSNA
jgi:hypothetical protein